MESAKVKRRRRMWEADPHCHFCGCETIYDNPNPVNPHKRLATVYHRVNKLDPRFKQVGRRMPVVLACYECANANARIEHERFREEAVKRSNERNTNPKQTPSYTVDQLKTILATKVHGDRNRRLILNRIAELENAENKQ